MLAFISSDAAEAGESPRRYTSQKMRAPECRARRRRRISCVRDRSGLACSLGQVSRDLAQFIGGVPLGIRIAEQTAAGALTESPI
jgi:hypothetical protein